MSSRLVGHVLEHYPRSASAAELALAIVLADEADHSGGNVQAVVPEMARLSRQSERTVRRLLKKMEADTWLQCVTRSPGGKGRASVYRINPEWVRLPLGFHFGASKPGHNPVNLAGFEGGKPCQPDRVCAPTPLSLSLESLQVLTMQDIPMDDGRAVPSAVGPEGEAAALDAKLARWMLGKIRQIHTRHRDPNFKRWERDLRLLRSDGHTHREIAELFAWANADRVPRSGDFCWATVILSPAKLRAQWDNLEIQRRQAQRQIAPKQADERCIGVLPASGQRCGALGTVRDGSDFWCIDCYQRRAA